MAIDEPEFVVESKHAHYEYTLDSLPTPNDSSVHLRQVAARKVHATMLKRILTTCL